MVKISHSFRLVFRWLRREALALVRDACLLAGFFGVVKGVWLIYEPAAYIVGGAMLIYAGLPPRGGGKM